MYTITESSYNITLIKTFCNTRHISGIICKKRDVYNTLMLYFPYMRRVGLIIDLDLWPTDLNINRDHLFIKYYLPTKFEACRTKHCLVISWTRRGRLIWPLTLTFYLLTWISIGIIYSLRTLYLPSLKVLGQSIVESPAVQVMGDQQDLWPWPLTYWPEYMYMYQ